MKFFDRQPHHHTEHSETNNLHRYGHITVIGQEISAPAEQSELPKDNPIVVLQQGKEERSRPYLPESIKFPNQSVNRFIISDHFATVQEDQDLTLTIPVLAAENPRLRLEVEIDRKNGRITNLQVPPQIELELRRKNGDRLLFQTEGAFGVGSFQVTHPDGKTEEEKTSPNKIGLEHGDSLVFNQTTNQERRQISALIHLDTEGSGIDFSQVIEPVVAPELDEATKDWEAKITQDRLALDKFMETNKIPIRERLSIPYQPHQTVKELTDVAEAVEYLVEHNSTADLEKIREAVKATVFQLQNLSLPIAAGETGEDDRQAYFKELFDQGVDLTLIELGYQAMINRLDRREPTIAAPADYYLDMFRSPADAQRWSYPFTNDKRSFIAGSAAQESLAPLYDLAFELGIKSETTRKGKIKFDSDLSLLALVLRIGLNDSSPIISRLHSLTNPGHGLTGYNLIQAMPPAKG